MRDFFQEQFALTFAGALYSLLDPPRRIFTQPVYPNYRKAFTATATATLIEGRLPLRQHGESGETSVGVLLRTHKHWLSRFPISQTDAPFLRRERDWHVPGGDHLCIGLDQEWVWHLQELWNKNVGWDTIVSVASGWCIRNLDSLITRHLHAHRFGITKWPKEWAQWSHERTGLIEFEQLIRRRAA